MAKGIFVTGTGTDVGKTYVTALIVKKLADAGIHAGYYKAALSGAESIEESDAGYVKKIAGITQEDSSLLSYLYQNAVSPHLAARIEGNPVDPETVKADFDRVKKEHIRKTYSFTSHISVYDECPIRYLYFKEYKFAPCEILHTSVGTLIHATLEDLNRFAIAGRYDEITEELIKKWFALNYAKMQESTGLMLSEERRKSALDQVLNYFDKRKEHIRKVWKAEEKVELVLPEYILQGVIDLIEDDDGKIEIVDYKTGRKPDLPEKSAQVEHYRKQLEIYAYLISERYKKNVSRMHLYYTNEAEENPLVTFEYSKNCVDKEIEDVSQTVRKIEDKRFDAKAENDYSCRYCDMKYMCKKVKNYD